MFTAAEVATARRYKYNGSDDSILGKLFMRRFWTWLIDFCPPGIAPNMITLIGLIFELASFIVSFHLSAALTQPLPDWACLVNAICLFFYQTLDSLDGKQARRTGSSSPLGQFFDHGCDALTAVFEMVKVAASLQLGNTQGTFLLVFITSIAFFFTSFQEYVTHHFYLGHINGPTEGLILLMIGQVMAGLFPSTLEWLQSRTVGILYLVGGCGTIISIVFDCIIQSISDRGKRWRAVIGVIPAVLSIAVFARYAITNPSNLENPFFTMSAGLILQYQAQQGIVGHLVLRGPFSTFYDLGVIIAWSVAIVPEFVQVGPEFWKYYLGLILSIMLVYDVRVILGFSRGLQIPIFTLPKRTSARATPH
jgi:phosphatidylglycerophosphate synthase